MLIRKLLLVILHANTNGLNDELTGVTIQKVPKRLFVNLSCSVAYEHTLSRKFAVISHIFPNNVIFIYYHSIKFARKE